MTTTRQLLRHCRQLKRRLQWSPDLVGNPQRRATCLKTTIRPPKKPNSAKRRIAKVELMLPGLRFQRLWVYVPGEGPNVDRHAAVLIRGGRVPDLPGIKYRIIRGKLGLLPFELRRRARSKYGLKKFKNLPTPLRATNNVVRTRLYRLYRQNYRVLPPRLTVNPRFIIFLDKLAALRRQHQLGQFRAIRAI